MTRLATRSSTSTAAMATNSPPAQAAARRLSWRPRVDSSTGQPQAGQCARSGACPFPFADAAGRGWPFRRRRRSLLSAIRRRTSASIRRRSSASSSLVIDPRRYRRAAVAELGAELLQIEARPARASAGGHQRGMERLGRRQRPRARHLGTATLRDERRTRPSRLRARAGRLRACSSTPQRRPAGPEDSSASRPSRSSDSARSARLSQAARSAAAFCAACRSSAGEQVAL